MPKFSRTVYYLNMLFINLWGFSIFWIILSIKFAHPEIITNLNYPLAGGVFFGFGVSGLMFSVVYFLIYTLLPFMFNEKLEALSIFPAFQRGSKYYMGDFGGGGPSYQSVSRKYSEWMKRDQAREIVAKEKKNLEKELLYIFIAGLLICLGTYFLM